MDQFLSLLGHDLGGDISVRAFYPKTDPRAKEKKGDHRTRAIAQAKQAAKRWEGEGKGVYLVVNGPGLKDADITQCRAVFYEHDNLAPELSTTLWQSLGLPQPSLQVDTGGKSIHTYWVLETPVAPADWKPLQADLIEYADGDRKCKNPSRVMRLPGFVHPETGRKAEVINATDRRYSFAELRALVPVVERCAPRAALPAHVERREGDLSLTAFLAKINRPVLEGVSEGSRNGDLHRLGMDLAGVEAWLAGEGEGACDRAEDLFLMACGRCNPPMGALADDPNPTAFWARIRKESNGPCLSDDKLRNILARQKRPSTPAPRGTEPEQTQPQVRSLPVEEDLLESHFESDIAQGLRFIKISFEKRGQVKREVTKVGDHLTAIAVAKSPDHDDYRIQVEFVTPQGLRTLTIKRLQLEGDGRDALELLVDNGYWYVRDSRKFLLGYLGGLGRHAEKVYTLSQKTGWVKDSFVLPDRSFGDKLLRFGQVELPKRPEFEEQGTLAEWQTHVAHLARGNSRLTFSLGVAFSAPLNPILGVESGGYHLYGVTSEGKTATMRAGISVYGKENPRKKLWRTTSNSLEYTAAAHNHLAMFLDEIGQAVPHDAAAAAYMLANGQGKARLRKDLSQRDILTWELVFLSTGEHTLASFLEQGEVNTKGGQENRMPSIPICGRSGEAFEQKYGMSSLDFVKTLEKNTASYTGTAFTAFMTALVETRSNEYDAILRQRHTSIRDELIDGHVSTKVLYRVADRMAAVQIGLELALEFEVLQHTHDEITWAIKTVFDDWVLDRGGNKDFELMQQCTKIEHLFVANEYSDRIISPNQFGESDRVSRNLLAYRWNDRFLVPCAIFKSIEFAGEINLSLLKKELTERGWLLPGRNGDASTVTKIGGKCTRGYVFRRFWGEE